MGFIKNIKDSSLNIFAAESDEYADADLYLKAPGFIKSSTSKDRLDMSEKRADPFMFGAITAKSEEDDTISSRRLNELVKDIYTSALA